MKLRVTLTDWALLGLALCLSACCSPRPNALDRIAAEHGQDLVRAWAQYPELMKAVVAELERK